MKTKEETYKKIEELEQEHINYCGYCMSDCGCCSPIINKLKEDSAKHSKENKEESE